jgi:hypothetical protein
MGTQRVQIKRVLPWLVRWACRAGTRDFSPALAALESPVQNTFSHAVHYFNPLTHRPASRAGSRAGSPVSQYVSLCSHPNATPNPTQLQLQ